MNQAILAVRPRVTAGGLRLIRALDDASTRVPDAPPPGAVLDEVEWARRERFVQPLTLATVADEGVLARRTLRRGLAVGPLPPNPHKPPTLCEHAFAVCRPRSSASECHAPLSDPPSPSPHIHARARAHTHTHSVPLSTLSVVDTNPKQDSVYSTVWAMDNVDTELGCVLRDLADKPGESMDRGALLSIAELLQSVEQEYDTLLAYAKLSTRPDEGIALSASLSGSTASIALPAQAPNT